MSNLKVFDNIKKLFNKKIELKNNIDNINERIDSSEHGFQLIKNDLGSYLRNFLLDQQINNRLSNINNLGYMSNEIGLILKSIIDDQNYDTYIKSVHSQDVDSIMNEGIRCLGTSSAISSTNPTDINDISLNNTITKVDDLTILVELVKKHNGFSQGFNAIDGSMILQIPKGINKKEIFYYNEVSNTYNIKPEFIVGFLPVNEKYIVSDFMYKEKDNSKAI